MNIKKLKRQATAWLSFAGFLSMMLFYAWTLFLQGMVTIPLLLVASVIGFLKKSRARG